jgi:hypothetical protein
MKKTVKNAPKKERQEVPYVAKKSVPKKVAEKKEEGKIEITVFKQRVSETKREMTVDLSVKGMSEFEVIECLAIVGQRLIANSLGEISENGKKPKVAKKVTKK